MDCNCKNGKFWVGLGMGAVLGMVAYYCVKSDKAKEWKQKIGCAAQQAADKAGEWMAKTKETVAETSAEK